MRRVVSAAVVTIAFGLIATQALSASGGRPGDGGATAAGALGASTSQPSLEPDALPTAVIGKPGSSKSKYLDTEFDAGCCTADIGKVDVSIKKGFLTFKVSTKNAKVLLPDDVFEAYIDNGPENFALVIDGGPPATAGLWWWNGSAWELTDATGGWLWKKGPQFALLMSDIGSPAAFSFYLRSQFGSTTQDFAPNSGWWLYFDV